MVKLYMNSGTEYLGFFVACNEDTRATNWSCKASIKYRILKLSSNRKPFTKGKFNSFLNQGFFFITYLIRIESAINLPNVYDQPNLNLLFPYKILNNPCMTDKSDLIPTNSPCRPFSLLVPRSKKDQHLYSFFPSTIRLWMEPSAAGFELRILLLAFDADTLTN